MNSNSTLKIVRKLSLALSLSFYSFAAYGIDGWADDSDHLKIESEKIYNGLNLSTGTLEQTVQQIPRGSIILIGEQHAFKPHHDHQILLMRELKRQGHQVSVGMEFIDVTQQGFLDQYLKNEVSEEQFLKAINWGGFDFDFYRRQVLFSRQSGGKTLGINAPRWLTRKISRSGIDSLTQEEKALVPPNFAIGDDDYFERFLEAIGGGSHFPRDQALPYFTAQSVWDDTMAYTSVKFMKTNPEQTLVIIVGDFHVSYGGGTPDRILARGFDKVFSISQVNLNHFETNNDRLTAVTPHERYGPRGHFIWTASQKIDPAK